MSITSAAVESRSPIDLTPDEMWAISEEITLKFSPNKASLAAMGNFPPAHVTVSAATAVLTERPATGNFSYRELQAISEDISQRFMPKASSSVPEILLLPVDPHHLYAYWDAGSSPPLIPDHNLQQPLTLRIYWRPNAKQEITGLNLYFDIPADNAAKRKKIRLPVDDTNYSATLGKLNPDHSLEVLAHSNLVHVPASPGKKRFDPDVSLPQSATGNEPLPVPSTVQEMLNAIQRQGAYFPLHSSMTPNSSPIAAMPGIARLYAELMSIFNDMTIDSERLPESGPAKPSEQASGLGL
ncbi:MAG: DUF4912 domain-containing protein [Methylomicrobium sp.]